MTISFTGHPLYMRPLLCATFLFLNAQILMANEKTLFQPDYARTPLTTKTISNLYSKVNLNDIPLQAPTFYLSEHPLKDAFYFSSLTPTIQTTYYPWHQNKNLSLPGMQALSTSSFALATQSQQINQLQITHASDNFSLQSRLLHDDGYKQHTKRNLFNLSLQKRQSIDDFTVDHFFLMNSIQQKDMTYIAGKNAYRVDSLKQTNPIEHASNNAYQMFYFANMQQDIGTDKVLTLKPYLRFNQTKSVLDEIPGLPKEEAKAGSTGIHTLFNKPYSESSDLTTAFRFDYTYADYIQQQDEYDSSPMYPKGKHYDFNVQTLSFNWQMLIEQQLDDDFSVTYDINVDKTHYFYKNYLHKRSACSSSVDSCMYQSPNQPDLSFFTWSPLIALNLKVNDNNSAQLRFYHDMQQPNSLDLYRLQKKQSIKAIKPMITNAAELAFTGQLSDTVEYAWIFYYRAIDHLILANVEGVNIFNNKVRSVGLNSFTRIDLSERLHLALGLGLTDAKYADDNKTASNHHVKLIPRTQGFATVDWQVLERSILKVTLTHVGHYYLDDNNTLSYNGHQLLDLYWLQKLPQAWQFTVAINNVTNKNYAWIGGTTRVTASNPSYEEKYVIGNPRSISVGVSKRF